MITVTAPEALPNLAEHKGFRHPCEQYLMPCPDTDFLLVMKEPQPNCDDPASLWWKLIPEVMQRIFQFAGAIPGDDTLSTSKFAMEIEPAQIRANWNTHRAIRATCRTWNYMISNTYLDENGLVDKDKWKRMFHFLRMGTALSPKQIAAAGFYSSPVGVYHTWNKGYSSMQKAVVSCGPWYFTFSWSAMIQEVKMYYNPEHKDPLTLHEDIIAEYKISPLPSMQIRTAQQEPNVCFAVCYDESPGVSVVTTAYEQLCMHNMKYFNHYWFTRNAEGVTRLEAFIWHLSHCYCYIFTSKMKSPYRRAVVPEAMKRSALPPTPSKRAPTRIPHDKRAKRTKR